MPAPVLIVGPSWVGDMVMTQPLVRLLRERTPGTPVDIAAPAWSAAPIERMPGVRRAIEAPFRHGRLDLGRRYRLGRALREEGYRQAIVLPNSFKSALLPLFARIPRRTGWRGEWRGRVLTDCRILDRGSLPRMVQRFAALAGAAGEALPESVPAPRLEADPEERDKALEELELHRDRPVLALCPGAEFGDAKQWPAAHHAALAQRMIERGWQVWLFGSAADREIATAIRTQVPAEQRARCHAIAGRTTLARAIDLLSVADAVVSNDSGLMHVAAALQRPLVALFGSTSWDFTPPLGEQVAMLATDIECRPCFRRQCPYGHRDCLVQLTPSIVGEALDGLLNEQRTGARIIPLQRRSSGEGG